MSFLKRVFTWWHGCTIGTGLFTWLNGSYVGDDEQGNRYYHAKKSGKRWVIYNGDIEASRIPPDWHRWLHYTSDEPPTVRPLVAKSWEKKHKANLTGSTGAYFPSGSLNETGRRPKATGDYEAWKPGA